MQPNATQHSAEPRPASVERDARGLTALLTAFTLWGVLPLYLRLLQPMAALQIIAHRVVFCCVFVLGWLRVRGELTVLRPALGTPAVRRRLIATALLISINWLTFVWAVSHRRVVESSLGYFINPLVNVLLGVLVLAERLRRTQWLAVALAGSGVAYLTWQSGAPPWIAFALAFSFSGYGLLRKTVAVDAMTGLAVETLLAAPFGLGYLVYCELAGQAALHRASLSTIGLLVASGPITAVPLWLFSYGARRIPYSTVGLIQYIGPTIQLLLGVFLFHEAFVAQRALGFALIWAGLALYGLDSLRQRGQPAAQ
jgi:chloramphenicol-sensitive protein RarD